MASETYHTLRVDREGAAMRITLDRPRVLNALSIDMLAELRGALGAAADREVRAVLLTGEGRGFCSGADLVSTPVDSDIQDVVEGSYNPVVRALAALDKPVVAGVNGIAIGAGMSLALACDMRLLSTNAQFIVGFTPIGFVMDASCSYWLPRLVGLGRAFELLFGERRVDAQEAVRIGLGERVLPEAGFGDACWDTVRALAEGPTRAYALAKRELHASLANDLEGQLALEARLQVEAATSRDGREGVAAFKEKRRPRFEGR